MIIKNFNNLASSYERKIVLQILEAGLSAGMPDIFLKKIMHKNYLLINKNKISVPKFDKIFVVAFGKAADSMTKALDSLIELSGGIVIIPQGVSSMLVDRKFEIIHGNHPVPNNKSTVAAKRIIQFLKERMETDFVIFLISGGGSSLVSLPDGVTLREKQIVTKLLLKAGANIYEINCVRKHLSKTKGGRMSDYLKCNAISLVISDVIGDDLSTIASGPTYYDTTTFQNALKILKKYGLEKSVSKNILKRISLGIQNKIPETPKYIKIKNYVIATNKNCLAAMTKKAKGLGLSTKTIYPVAGDVRTAAKRLSKMIPKKPKSCLIFGGETTVIVKGRGKGGRNQELVLYGLTESQKINNDVTIASIGTDGKDGNSDACGAVMNNFEFNSKEAQEFLQNNDSYCFLKKHNGLIFTGPTHTNLMDIGIILRN